MDSTNIIAIILFPLLILFLGFFGSIFTRNKIHTWYLHLKKPKLNPPNWIFGPVWSILYISIGISGYIFWSTKQAFDSDDFVSWFFYFFQIFLNLAWTPIFFGLNYLILSGIVNILMDLTTIINIILFWKKTYLAGCILIPYLLWICFATYLNFSIWYLNNSNSKMNFKKNIKVDEDEINQIKET